MTLTEIEALIATLPDSGRRQLFSILRNTYGLKIHPLESKWNTTAEAILEAISEAGDLTQRGIRGVLAEATFRTVVVPKKLREWRIQQFVGEQSYDLILTDNRGPVRVQVKLQRRERGIPKLYKGKSDHYAVETQRTRGGKWPDDEASRPYRVDEFDVLAVCLHPSTEDWESFIYCATRDLLVRAADPRLLEVMQPIPMNSPETWTFNFDSAVLRFRRPSLNSNQQQSLY